MLSAKSTLLNILGLNPTGDLGPLTGYTSKRGKAVWFLKAPPTTPATPYQNHQRNIFRLVAMAWRALPADVRQAWLDAAPRAHLRITGYNLFTYWQITRDRPTLRTIEHLAQLELIE